MKILFSCLAIIAVVYGSYDEDLARYKAWPMASSAYSSHPALCIKDNFKNSEFKGQYTEACDLIKGDTCSGFTAVSHSDKAIILSFRGSDGYVQIADEVIEALFDKEESFVGGGAANKYFMDAFDIVWNAGMKNDFNTLKNKNPGYDLWVTGHSLGAALASIGAATISKMGYFPPDKIKLITFGQPRVGNAGYANAVDDLVKYAFRVVHNHDWVPHLPLKNMLGYIHHKSEVWYPNNMTVGSKFIECDQNESKKCSDGTLDLSPNDHSWYFNMNSAFAKNGCPGYNPNP